MVVLSRLKLYICLSYAALIIGIYSVICFASNWTSFSSVHVSTLQNMRKEYAYGSAIYILLYSFYLLVALQALGSLSSSLHNIWSSLHSPISCKYFLKVRSILHPHIEERM